MSVQKKSLISSSAVNTKVAEPSEKSTSIGGSKSLQASALKGLRVAAMKKKAAKK